MMNKDGEGGDTANAIQFSEVRELSRYDLVACFLCVCFRLLGSFPQYFDNSGGLRPGSSRKLGKHGGDNESADDEEYVGTKRAKVRELYDSPPLQRLSAMQPSHQKDRDCSENLQAVNLAGAGLGKLLCCHIDVCPKYYRKYVEDLMSTLPNDIFVSSRVRMIAHSAQSA
jgi:hypothetical protein